MQYLISITWFITSFGATVQYFIPSKQTCNKINKCYNPITKQCDQWAFCYRFPYCQFASCDAYPDAQCRINMCGEICTTYFMDAFNQIIEDCDVDICTLQPEFGDGKGYLTRYYFDDETKQCDAFIYTGRGGNANNFQTLSDCQQTCDQIPHCVPAGWSFMDGPDDCYLMDFVCNLDEEYWFNSDCGCGCKPKETTDCPPKGWTFMSNAEKCGADGPLLNHWSCGSNEEYWFIDGCGCGCRPCEDEPCKTEAPCNEWNCLVEPCKLSSCDNYPDATCENDYCNGCTAIWTDSNDQDVTKLCQQTPTTSTKPVCVPDGWNFIGDDKTCIVIFYACEEGFEPWSIGNCGCGCKPKK